MFLCLFLPFCEYIIFDANWDFPASFFFIFVLPIQLIEIKFNWLLDSKHRSLVSEALLYQLSHSHVSINYISSVYLVIFLSVFLIVF